MEYEDEEVFIDAGCFDLSSSIELRKHCKRVKKVYAFEPDPENYKKCLARKKKEKFSEAEIFPYGTWSEQKICYFDARSDHSARVSETGGYKITMMPIDEVLAQEGHGRFNFEKVTLIKMDIEGSELESLIGAKQVIQRDKPKLAICIYHKPEDMIMIPLYIKELVPEYKLYIRHHSTTQYETVLYAVAP